MSRETLWCVFQVLSFGMDPLFWVCEKAKIWSPCLMEPLLKKKKLDQNFVGFEVFRSPSLTGNIMYIVSSPHAYVPVSSRISTHRLLLLLYSTRIRPVYVLVLNLHIVIVILLLLPLLPVPQPTRPTSYYSSAHRRPGISRIANSHELWDNKK